MKTKRRLSEKHFAYLFILPAMLIISAVALWPVLRTFWLSLYDVQLNDPTKNDTYIQYGLDMDNFVEQYPLLTGHITQDINKTTDQTSLSQLKQINNELSVLKTKLDAKPNFQKQYEQIDNLLYNDSNVPDNLMNYKLDKTTAIYVISHFKQITKQTNAISLANQDKNILLGLLNGLQKTVIEPNFIGLGHYTDLLDDSRFWSSMFNTIVFTVISVFIEFVLGLAIAVLINRQFRGRGIVRASVLVPWAIPTVVSALMWKFMFDGQNGILAKVFQVIGLIPNMGVLLTTKVGSMFAVIFADVWKTTPFVTLLLLAGLQTIPTNLYEAARVDGASKTQQFFRITLPLLKPTILVTLLFRTLDAFRVFDLVYVLTGGGPANSTETISIYTYKAMFAQMNFGLGSALSVMVFICIALISILYIRFLGTNIMGDSKSH